MIRLLVAIYFFSSFAGCGRVDTPVGRSLDAACSSSDPSAPAPDGLPLLDPRVGELPSLIEHGQHRFRLSADWQFKTALDGWTPEAGAYGVSSSEFLAEAAIITPDGLRLELRNKQAREGTLPDRPYAGAGVVSTEPYPNGIFIARLRREGSEGALSSFIVRRDLGPDRWQGALLELSADGRRLHCIYDDGGSLRLTKQVTLDFDIASESASLAIEFRPGIVACYLNGARIAEFSAAANGISPAAPWHLGFTHWIHSGATFNQAALPLTMNVNFVAVYRWEECTTGKRTQRGAAGVSNF